MAADMMRLCVDMQPMAFVPVFLPLQGHQGSHRVEICRPALCPEIREVRRCFFTAENHVPLCGLDVCGLPREIISHMDGCRFVHMMSRKTGTVSQYLASADVKSFEQTCFLGPKLEWDLLGVCLLGVRCLLSQLWNFVQIAVAEFGNWFNAY